VIKKEAEKILKYKDLTIEIQGMWNVNLLAPEFHIYILAHSVCKM